MSFAMILVYLLRLIARTGYANAFAAAIIKPHLFDGPALVPLATAQQAPDEFKKAVRDMLRTIADSVNRPLVKILLINVVIPLVTDVLLDQLWDVVFKGAPIPKNELEDAIISEVLFELY